MENTLNLNGGWEAVVNNPDRQERIDQFHANRREKKIGKLAEKVMIFAIVAMFFFLMGITGALMSWISLPLTFVFVVLAIFNYGRYTELARR